MAPNDEMAESAGRAGPVLDVVDIAVQDGEFEPESWLYVWLTSAEPLRVVYVGATWLPPAVRTFLHLHDPDPNVGRIRAQHPELTRGSVSVRAFRLDAALDRPTVRSMVVGLLDGDEVESSSAAGRAAHAVVSVLHTSTSA